MRISSENLGVIFMMGWLGLTTGCKVVQLSVKYWERLMDIVIDTSALIAVIVNEPERERIIAVTAGNTLIGPGSIPWEIGNAFSAMFKRSRLSLDGAAKGIKIFEGIPLRYVKSDLANAIRIAKETGMYAYDAYFLDCAVRHKSPLLTLDVKLMKAAKAVHVDVLEV